MEKITSNKLYSFLYLLAVYLGIKLLPLIDWLPQLWQANLIQIALYLILIGLIIYECRRIPLHHRKNKDHLSYFLLLPMVLGCMSNLLYCWFFGIEPKVSIDSLYFPLNSVITILCVSIEELLLRFLFFSFVEDMVRKSRYSVLWTVLFSSIAFSLMHCINFFGNAPLNVLLQLGYTFVLGLALGSLAILFESPIIPILGHFLFNFLNTDLYVSLYQAEINTSYVLFSVGVIILLILYLILLYYLTWRKKQHATS